MVDLTNDIQFLPKNRSDIWRGGKCNEPSQCLDSGCGWGYDLGTEKISQWALDKLYTIIENRNENKLPIIVTTRFDKESLLDRFYQSEDEELAEDVIEKLYQFCYGIELKKYDENEKKKVSISD